jgi:uncharacterized protein YabN with tetrapyrrole methylase and pyrophosphatase domain
MSATESKYDIYILSYGLNPYRDMTLQTLEYLQRCTEVYVIANKQISAFLESHYIHYVDIGHMYKKDMKREKIYQNIASFVIEQVRNKSGICYLTYGNPMLFDKSCQLILERATKLGLSICLVPALSFLDVLLVYIQVPIDTWGFTVYEATRLVNDEIILDKRVPCFIAQIGSFRNIYARGDEATPQEALYPLVDYLRRFYSADYIVTLCDSDESKQGMLFLEIPLCLLPLVADGLTNATTLYIPGERI